MGASEASAYLAFGATISENMKKKISKKLGGFTLIEIMVVIVIIGILIGIVIIVAGPVGMKAKDAKIKSGLIQLQNLAERIYLDEGNYQGVICTPGLDCFDCDPGIKNLCLDIKSLVSNFDIAGSPSNNNYCAFAGLPSKGINPTWGVSNVFFCVDSQGRTAEGDVFAIAGTCYDDYRCP